MHMEIVKKKIEIILHINWNCQEDMKAASY